MLLMLNTKMYQHVGTRIWTLNSVRRDYGKHYNLLVSNMEKIKIVRIAQFILAAGWSKKSSVSRAAEGLRCHQLNYSTQLERKGMAEKMASVFPSPHWGEGKVFGGLF